MFFKTIIRNLSIAMLMALSLALFIGGSNLPALALSEIPKFLVISILSMSKTTMHIFLTTPAKCAAGCRELLLLTLRFGWGNGEVMKLAITILLEL